MQCILMTSSLKVEFALKMSDKSVLLYIYWWKYQLSYKQHSIHFYNTTKSTSNNDSTKVPHWTVCCVNIYSGSVISLEKHTPQCFTSFITSLGISWLNSDTFHLFFIIFLPFTISEPTWLETISSTYQEYALINTVQNK